MGIENLHLLNEDTPPKYEIALETDVKQAAYDELMIKRGSGEQGWDMAAVRDMLDPPITKYQYVVFRILN